MHTCDDSTVIGETVFFAGVQSSLSFGKLCGRNHFHGLPTSISTTVHAAASRCETYFCDFLNVFDRLQTHLDFTEGGHVTGI